jgi:hypothetical protein
MGLFLPYGRRGRGDGAAPPITGGVVLDRSSVVVVVLILAAILGDFALNDGRAVMFLLLKLADLVEYLQIWR